MDSGVALLTAIQVADEDAAAKEIDDHADVDARDQYGATSLMWAVERHSEDLVRKLLQARADPNRADSTGLTPLQIAIGNREPRLAMLLLANGASANARRDTGETVLMTAARTGQIEVMRELLRRGADVNAHENAFRQSALMWAAGYPEQIKLLIGHGADIHARSRSWQVTYPVYPDTRDPIRSPESFYTLPAGGQTPLLFAVQADDVASVKTLLAAGADVNESAADGTTALLLCLLKWDGRARFGEVRYGLSPTRIPLVPNVELANLLLDSGARVDVHNAAGYTPLHAAVLGMTPVKRLAAFSGHESTDDDRKPIADAGAGLSLVERLLALKADPNGVTSYSIPGPVGEVRLDKTPPGSTPLHIAALAGNVRLVELLLETGGDPNHMNERGQSPLSIAVAADDLSVLQMLAAHGGDLQKIYNPSQFLASYVPSSLAATQPRDSIEQAIAAARQMSWRVRRGETLMHIAAASRAYHVIPFLAEQGVSVSLLNSEGEAALKLADIQEYYAYVSSIDAAVLLNESNSGAKKDLKSIVRETKTSDTLREIAVAKDRDVTSQR